MTDLPIYSDSVFRGPNPFPALEGVERLDLGSCFDRFDALLDHGEGARGVDRARRIHVEPARKGLEEVHRILFTGREGAGEFRRVEVPPPFRGQDCPPPEFIGRSLDNLDRWLREDSFAELHPIQQAALALVRLIDIWPFEFGNRTTGVVFANHFVIRAGYPPFFVPADQVEEFEKILARSILMETEPLVSAIYNCMARELERVRG